MITYLRTSLFDSPAQTLVNTVNTVGVMGKGIAKEFKSLYPAMFAEYRKLCMASELSVGRLQLWRSEDRWVLNFPTKTTWKQPSKLAYIEQGLETFVNSYKEMGVSSIAFPPLGCGNGNLDWKVVKPLMEEYLQPLTINVYIHDRQVAVDFVPEHSSVASETPNTISALYDDLADLIAAGQRSFSNVWTKDTFNAKLDADNGIVAFSGDKAAHILPDYIEWAWSALQIGLLTSQQFPSLEAKTAASYLFSLLIQLPYVQASQISKPAWDDSKIAYGLYFKRGSAILGRKNQNLSAGADTQLCLYQNM